MFSETEKARQMATQTLRDRIAKQNKEAVLTQEEVACLLQGENWIPATIGPWERFNQSAKEILVTRKYIRGDGEIFVGDV